MSKRVFSPGDILLPKPGTDMTKWSVVACDQYTSEPEYWNEVSSFVGNSPSTLHITFPEIYLEDGDGDKRIESINKNMRAYIDIADEKSFKEAVCICQFKDQELTKITYEKALKNVIDDKFSFGYSNEFLFIGINYDTEKMILPEILSIEVSSKGKYSDYDNEVKQVIYFEYLYDNVFENDMHVEEIETYEEYLAIKEKVNEAFYYIDEEGVLWGNGYNDAGQLGLNKAEDLNNLDTVYSEYCKYAEDPYQCRWPYRHLCGNDPQNILRKPCWLCSFTYHNSHFLRSKEKDPSRNQVQHKEL